MCEIKALEKLREWASQHKGWSLYDIEINEIADEIEREIFETLENNPYDAVSCEHVISPDTLHLILDEWDIHPGWTATNENMAQLFSNATNQRSDDNSYTECAEGMGRSLKQRITELEEQCDALLRYLDHDYRIKAENAELTAERDQWREAAGNAHDMWEEADAERNELRREVDRLTRENISLARDLCECMAERDEWIAKLEKETCEQVLVDCNDGLMPP